MDADKTTAYTHLWKADLFEDALGPREPKKATTAQEAVVAIDRTIIDLDMLTITQHVRAIRDVSEELECTTQRLQQMLLERKISERLRHAVDNFANSVVYSRRCSGEIFRLFETEAESICEADIERLLHKDEMSAQPNKPSN